MYDINIIKVCFILIVQPLCMNKNILLFGLALGKTGMKPEYQSRDVVL